jgi:hypothetical protein
VSFFLLAWMVGLLLGCFGSGELHQGVADALACSKRVAESEKDVLE